jgi:murein DD-endopeptidase MepM/ murein hydrolase activator NlpD
MTAVTSAAAFSALQGQSPANAAKGKTAADAAKQFEQLLAFELLKTMRATVPESEDGESGFASDALDSMFDQAVAESSAGRLGVAPMLERQLDPNAAQTRAIPEEENSLTSPIVPKALAEGRSPSPSHSQDGATFGGALPSAGDLPVQGRMSSDFGWRTHPISGEKKFHGGMDIAAPTGTEIRAAQRGLVTFAGNRPGYGNVVEIRHPDGTTGRYAHASRLHVETGDKIDVGETIADVGATGQVTGPHLHFEVRKNGHPIDPERWLDRQRSSKDDLDPSRTGIAIE